VDEQSLQTNPRTGRRFAWLAVAGLMLGLTAFYQAMMHGSGGLVESVGQGGNAMIVLERDRSGHYRAEGTINGHAVNFLVDTGATDVAVSERSARTLGLDFGPRTTVMTAAGPAPAWKTRIDRVTVGSLERENVRATITPGLGSEALLGMSFLRHYDIRQQGDRLVIESATSNG
jgi:aspartyl protease family protein